MDMRTGRLRARLMTKLRVIISTITATIRPISRVSEAAIAAKLTDAPSSITSTSSNCLALKASALPERRRSHRGALDAHHVEHRDAFGDGLCERAKRGTCHNVRTAMPCLHRARRRPGRHLAEQRRPPRLRQSRPTGTDEAYAIRHALTAPG
jgi:hypothetical protein